MIPHDLDMRRIDFLVCRQYKYLSLELAEEMCRDISPVFSVDSCEGCVDNERNFVITQLNERVIQRHDKNLLFTGMFVLQFLSCIKII